MTVQGDLQDVSLSSLIQMLCTDKREAVLLLQNQSSKDGVIFFDDGEIIHARTGDLVGEDAIFQLLGWSGGTFRMGHDVRMPRRTVNAPWHYLLLEGMKQLDEQRAAGTLPLVQTPAAAAPLTAAQKAHDQQFEQEMIMLFSQLEFTRAQASSRASATQIWHATAEMLNQTVSFAESYLSTADCSLSDALQIGRSLYPALQPLTAYHNRLAAGDLQNAYQLRPDRLHTELIPGVLELLEGFFHRLSNYFYNHNTAAEWEDTGRVFLNDFKQILERSR